MTAIVHGMMGAVLTVALSWFATPQVYAAETAATAEPQAVRAEQPRDVAPAVPAPEAQKKDGVQEKKKETKPANALARLKEQKKTIVAQRKKLEKRLAKLEKKQEELIRKEAMLDLRIEQLQKKKADKPRKDKKEKKKHHKRDKPAKPDKEDTQHKKKAPQAHAGAEPTPSMPPAADKPDPAAAQQAE